jgi:precorrin-8X/cobalt-precorrin-8 methylmutase
VQVARQLRFSRGVAAAAKKAIGSGATIVTDVNMVKAGINSRLMKTHGNRAFCAIHHADVARRAKAKGITRAAAAMQKHRGLLHDGIAVIGNAPSALYAVLDMVASGVRPGLIIGVPVGFVGAAESKQELEKCTVPFITLRGTRGGSGVGAGILNALLMMNVKGRGVARL